MAEARILVADDDREIVQLIKESLDEEGFEVVTAYNGQEAFEKVNQAQPNLVILDIMMPELDGLEVCRRVRQELSAPIILLSAKSREIDKVVGLEVGADDYLTKPFSINELVARVKAHLRRERRVQPSQQAPSSANNILYYDDISINKDTYEVFKGGQPITLSTKEFQILLYLIENRNIVLSREQIYDAIWGNSEFGDLNTVTVHIKNIRAKLDVDNRYIKTVWGIGYKFTGGTL
ncbi:MAG TPA: response regulator transcription factor [Bacillota bacterium]|nr:response regulator transcription factor [Bacillota bacterium]